MCCFSQTIAQVSRTQVFARAAGIDQFLVYSMDLRTKGDVAMILPLPVPPGSAEDSVRFINLEKSPWFFRRLDNLFKPPEAGGYESTNMSVAARKKLVVHSVGAFEASFVPRVADFDRLEPRFRLSKKVWKQLPQYADWGFAVFKLRSIEPWWRRFISRLAPLSGVPDSALPTQEYHPMAFSFPRRDYSTLFFPTIHVHDGMVHPSAQFDHMLYAQLQAASTTLQQDDYGGRWLRSYQLASPRQDTPEEQLLVAKRWVFRIELRGSLPNRDLLLSDPLGESQG